VPGEEVGRPGKTFANLYLAQYCEHDKVVNEMCIAHKLRELLNQ
jgi:hypothetical protein